MVYVRPGGVTAANVRKADADARQFAALAAVDGRVSPPAVSADHQAIVITVAAILGYNSDISEFVSSVKDTAVKAMTG